MAINPVTGVSEELTAVQEIRQLAYEAEYMRNAGLITPAQYDLLLTKLNEESHARIKAFLGIP